MSRNVGFRGFWMFWWGRCFRLLFSRRLCWELPCEGEFGWVVVEGWGVIGNFWISGHLPKCRRMRTWWRFCGFLFSWWVSFFSDMSHVFPRPAPRAIFEGHLERDREREFGWVVFAWGIREENFDLMYFWISPQNVHNNKNVVTVCSSSPP